MAENGQALIKLDGVTKVFFTDEVETHALSGIHLQINKGEYVAIAGPSGCGKSTLLSILGLLDSPTEGQFTLNGRPVAELAASERARLVHERLLRGKLCPNRIGLAGQLIFRDLTAHAERFGVDD